MITPRSDVVAVWLKARVKVERKHRNNHPAWDRFTAMPPKRVLNCEF
jgi:hypothetical protein